MKTYRVYKDGVVQDTAVERAPFVGIGAYEVVEACTPEEAVSIAANVRRCAQHDTDNSFNEVE